MKRHLLAVLGLALAMPVFASYDNIDNEVLAFVEIENPLAEPELYFSDSNKVIYKLDDSGKHLLVNELYSGQYVTRDKSKKQAMATGGIIIMLDKAGSLSEIKNDPSIAEYVEVTPKMVIMQIMPDLNLIDQLYQILDMPGVISADLDFSEKRNSPM